MSVTIEAAKRKIEILERLVDNPPLILTDLFSDEVSGCNFLYQISVEGKHILDYLKEYMAKIPVFADCVIQNSSYNFFIYMNALKAGEYQDFQRDDKVIKINVSNKTFKVCTECLAGYENVMTQNYELKVESISDWWERYASLTFTKRICNAFASFNTSKSIFNRILDFIFWLRVPRKRTEERFEEEKTRVERINKSAEKTYAEKIEKQNIYLQQAPSHITNIQEKQWKITDYLIGLGFQENSEMTEY